LESFLADAFHLFQGRLQVTYWNGLPSAHERPEGTKTIATVLAGSRLYALHTAQSDYDWRYVYVTPDEFLTGYHRRPDTVHSNPTPQDDCQGWELDKFVRMAVAGSFTALEVLYAPITHRFYEIAGDQLFEQRHLFLTERVRSSLLGFVNGQIKDATNRSTFKPIKHVVRVLLTLSDLYSTGALNFRPLMLTPVVDMWRVGWESNPSTTIAALVEWADEIHRFPNQFPRDPDLNAVHQLVLDVREAAR
jgi:predicted nucleotidyltransferase